MGPGAIAAMSAGGDIASTLLSGHFNARSAEKQMRFQERMSNTQYQRAAADLEAAGLNRILALGSPASAPAGASATMPDARAGSSAGHSYVSASSAKSAISLQRQQEALLEDQRINTQQDTRKKAAETATAQNQLNVQDADITLKQAQALQAESVPDLNNATAARTRSEIPYINQSTRLRHSEADVGDVKRSGYRAAAPLVNRVIEAFDHVTGTNARDVSPGVPRSKGDPNKGLFMNWFNRTFR